MPRCNSAEWDEKAACAGKVQYGTFDAASRALARRRGLKGNYQIYACAACHQWHIGNGVKEKFYKRQPARERHD